MGVCVLQLSNSIQPEVRIVHLFFMWLLFHFTFLIRLSSKSSNGPLQGIPYIKNISGASVAFQLDVFEVRKISEIFGSQWSSEPCKILQVTTRIKTVYSYQSTRSASRNEDQNFWLMRGRRGKRVLVIPKQDFFAVRWNTSTGSSNLFFKLKGV